MAKSKTRKASVSLSWKDIKKFLFWVVVPLLVLIAFYFTAKAKSAIQTQYDQKKTQITSEKQGVDKIASNDSHPNDKTVKAITEEREVLSKNVYDAWMLMYQDQKSRNRWPSQLPPEFLDIVENAKFRDNIAVGRPYILEDYAYFMVNNLPELIKSINRRRCQVRDYQFIENKSQPNGGRFEPVYVDPKDGLLYVVADKDVWLYNKEEDFLSKVEESDLRDYLIGLDNREPYYRELDPMIINPRAFVEGNGLGNRGNIQPTPGRMSGAGGGMGAGGDEPTGMSGVSGAAGRFSNTQIPGDGFDPAVTQIRGEMNSPRSVQSPGNAASNELYPGLPPYQERRRIVGNIDWTNPEIFSLLRWGQGQVPYSVQIWYLQEDLWVYEAIIRVLVETNKEADNNISLAPVKCVEQMLIGQNASAAWLTLKSLSLAGNYIVGGPAGNPSMGAGMSSMSSMDEDDDSDMASSSPVRRGVGPMGGVSGGMGAESPETFALKTILENRYLDAENNPLPADATPPFAEFNRMPVVLKLVVDQRRIPDVLVNCANCSMPIDVRHVRICPDTAGGASSILGTRTTSSPSSSGSMSDDDSGMPMTSPSRPVGGSSGGVSIGRSELSQTGGYGADAIRVEIYGIINIFNEPNPEIFGTGSAGSESEAEGAEAATEENAPTAATEENAPTAATEEIAPAAATEENAPAAATEENAPAAEGNSGNNAESDGSAAGGQ